jgi:hypothetical protein
MEDVITEAVSATDVIGLMRRIAHARVARDRCLGDCERLRLGSRREGEDSRSGSRSQQNLGEPS